MKIHVLYNDERALKRVYHATLFVTAEALFKDTACLLLEAEEMTEVYVNRQLAAVLFWSPQRVDIKAFLHEGDNEVQLVVRGSLANRYGNRPVDYGLKQAGLVSHG